MTRRGVGQDYSSLPTLPIDNPTPTFYPIATTPSTPVDLNALQGQVNATADVVSSILASSPSVQTTGGIATASPSNTGIYLVIGLVACLALFGAVK
jgi:hypothetical protein